MITCWPTVLQRPSAATIEWWHCSCCCAAAAAAAAARLSVLRGSSSGMTVGPPGAANIRTELLLFFCAKLVLMLLEAFGFPICVREDRANLEAGADKAKLYYDNSVFKSKTTQSEREEARWMRVCVKF
jgi:hypothetical protein